VLDEGVVLESVFGAFYVHLFERVSGQFVFDDVLGCNAEEPGIGDAKVAVDVRAIFRKAL
jgi:hypothetical protein